jgi:hypothetical protein
VMEMYWGKIPRQAWDKASGAYGDSVHAALNKAKELLRGNPQYLVNCLAQMGVDDAIGTKLRISLGIERSKSPGLGH